MVKLLFLSINFYKIDFKSMIFFGLNLFCIRGDIAYWNEEHDNKKHAAMMDYT